MKLNIHKNVYINAYSSNICKSQQVEATEISINGRTEKQNVIYPYNEGYPIIKRNEARIHATTWMDLANMILNQRGQSQRPHYL